jgi:sRNA-binding protein
MKVTLGTLKDKGEELTTFLEPRVGTKPTLDGGEIEIEDGSVREGVKPRDVKTYIKRFLYMKGVRKNYRVFVAGKELTIQEIVLSEKEKEEKKEAVKKEMEVAKEKEEPAEEAPETPAEAPEAPAEKPEKAKKAPSKKPKARKKKTDSSD